MTAAPVVLLGPQMPEPNVVAALQGVPEGPLAVVSAAWQETEGDVGELQRVTGRRLIDLELYARAETLFRSLPDFAARYRERQDRLKVQQSLYRVRLRQLVRAARQMLQADVDRDVLEPELRHAVAQLRALDRHHLGRLDATHRTCDEGIEAAAAEPLAEHRSVIRATLSACAGVLIPGGNVAVLINRLRLFGVDRMLAGKPVVAWSAGAMALTERIVVFHDRVAHGRREPEILGRGCDLAPGLVVLPDAEQRLRRGDRSRMSLLARRFAPAECVAMENGSLLRLDGSEVSEATDTTRIRSDGRFVRRR